ncbi:uncharacterized protein F5891DRAFT_976149 [Suillus fuscotomentosus]|uniref:Uncharacterized protein n=1 Tax=Suillus fuscotomentosus TaxID=1912939 RepID=A0AAD4EGY9_9AGAM|nr:uncharacterized protein F5891DRAFT_976149 [Suillus fuscotomentosus]KAG1906055.1 hypothetical protein F5891DRAFT_976149 [Suillus fuscotomentosus]
MIMEDLTKLKITCTGFIRLKPDLAERIMATTALGHDEFWSSALAQTLRAWIEPFLFRASAMLPSNTCMVLSMKWDVPATIVSLSNFYVNGMSPCEMKTNMPRSFFVMDAKLCNPSDNVPQAVCKMFTYGKFFEASYKQSVVLSMDPYHTPDDQLVNPELWPDLIAAILAHWIENSFADLGSDDWFELSLDPGKALLSPSKLLIISSSDTEMPNSKHFTGYGMHTSQAVTFQYLYLCRDAKHRHCNLEMFYHQDFVVVKFPMLHPKMYVDANLADLNIIKLDKSYHEFCMELDHSAAPPV